MHAYNGAQKHLDIADGNNSSISIVGDINHHFFTKVFVFPELASNLFLVGQLLY